MESVQTGAPAASSPAVYRGVTAARVARTRERCGRGWQQRGEGRRARARAGARAGPPGGPSSSKLTRTYSKL